MTVISDLIILKNKIVSLLYWSKIFVAGGSKILSFIKFKKSGGAISDVVDAVVSTTEPKVTIFQKLSFKMFPKARLTYWLADEEVVVYVDKFHQKDKFKLIFRELISGKIVLVNSATPINYRLEQLSPADKIAETVIQQDQRYN